MTIPTCISPIMSLIMVLKTLFSFGNRDVEDSRSIYLLRVSLIACFFLLVMMYNFMFIQTDDRPPWAARFPYNKMDTFWNYILKFKNIFNISSKTHSKVDAAISDVGKALKGIDFKWNLGIIIF